jgi:hypothetical protein
LTDLLLHVLVSSTVSSINDRGILGDRKGVVKVFGKRVLHLHAGHVEIIHVPI